MFYETGDCIEIEKNHLCISCIIIFVLIICVIVLSYATKVNSPNGNKPAHVQGLATDDMWPKQMVSCEDPLLISDAQDSLKLFVYPQCGWCQKLKTEMAKYFKEFNDKYAASAPQDILPKAHKLDSLQVHVMDISNEKNYQEFLNLVGEGKGVPVLCKGSEKILDGYSKDFAKSIIDTL